MTYAQYEKLVQVVMDSIQYKLKQTGNDEHPGYFEHAPERSANKWVPRGTRQNKKLTVVTRALCSFDTDFLLPRQEK